MFDFYGEEDDEDEKTLDKNPTPVDDIKGSNSLLQALARERMQREATISLQKTNILVDSTMKAETMATNNITSSSAQHTPRQ